MKKRTIISVVAAILLGTVPALADSQSLDGKWTLDFWEQGKTAVTSPAQMQGVTYNTVEATVPGNVELDLLNAGLIENPETGSNVYLLRPYEGYQWRYRTAFKTPEHEPDDDVILDFEGIDCYGEIYVNGIHVGSSANMLIPYDFDVTSALNGIGENNTLEVYIRSTVVEGRKEIVAPISLNFAQPESIYSRRPPHTYGWDIMPRLVSAGLFRSVNLKVVKPVHIRDVNWITLSVDTSTGSANMRADYNITLPVSSYGKLMADFKLSRNGREVQHFTMKVASHAAACCFNMQNVDFWWPRGYGEPALYDAQFSVLDLDGNVLDSNVQKIGIRTVKLDYTPVHTPDKPGRFCFVVNGENIYARGSNWTPLDALHSRDPQWMEKTVDLALDLNCNMLRCWGGGLYESDEFYDLCDANGILIWQDFVMGCSFYSQMEDFQRALTEEIRSVVLRLRRHPSIALWAGNNENDATIACGTLSSFRIDPNKDVVSRQTIPNVLYELDPSRTYLPSSPYWSEELCRDYYSPEALPEDHIWGPRGYYKDAYYTNAKCIFVSEIGYHGMPNRSSLERMFTKENVYPWTDSKNFRWKEDWLTKAVRRFEEEGYTPERNNLMINQSKCLWNEVPSDLDRFIFASQAVQAEAMKYFVERYRGHKFAPCSGMLWWNVRDGWPVISDAVVDWYFSPKLAYYFIRNSQFNVCVMMNDPEDGGYPLVVANDTNKSADGVVTVKDVESGKTVFTGEYRVDANGREVIAHIPERQGQGMFLITYSSPDGEHSNHYLYGKAPYSLDKYRKWLVKTGIYNEYIKK